MNSCRAIIAAGFLISVSITGHGAEPRTSEVARHPFDPLSSKEITLASKLVTEYKEFPEGALFPMIGLNEPPKPEIKAHLPGNPFRREALCTVLDRAANKTYEAVVDLKSKKVVSWENQPGVQPLVLAGEYELVPKIVNADPGWQEAMRKRGITDPNNVQVDTWATGQLVSDEHKTKRLLRAVPYYKEGTLNYYSRPIEGLSAIVDMNSEKIVQLIDSKVVPIATGQELEIPPGKQRKDVKPLRSSQPAGASFQVKGNEVHWQKWQFRFAMDPREGLILYTVGYNDQGRVRPVLYRAAMSETVVPYGDPDVQWAWRNAFDEGEYGVGRLASPLEPNRDAPSNAVFFDANFADDFGKPYVMKNAVGLYERDGGILWKHYDYFANKNQTRRARELVLFFVATIGNYDYCFHYIFGQDGSLVFDVGSTGIMLPKGVKEVTANPHEELADHGEPVSNSSDEITSHYGHLVSPNIVAAHHQHFFNFRLDLDVDGTSNSIIELNSRPEEAGPDNPYNNAISMKESSLGSEENAKRDLNFASSRSWRVINNAVDKTALGYSPGYALVPGENAAVHIGAEASVRKRAPFLNHHFWVTRYKEGERHAAGYYPNQGDGSEGLALWTSDNESLVDEDVVVWYTVGMTHIPRPEEWPVMPVNHTTFKLLPSAFFTENPAMDVPAESQRK